MASQRSPPSSPRAPKIQQESWDELDSPPIDLYNPSTNRSKAPKSSRKFRKPSVISPTPSSGKSSTYNSPNPDQRSPKYDNPPRSPKITTTYANDDDDDANNTEASDEIESIYQTPTGPRSPLPSSGSGGSYYDKRQQQKQRSHYHKHQQSSSPRCSPNSPKKFVFDAISPRYEKRGIINFEYYETAPINIPPSEETDFESTCTPTDTEDSPELFSHPLYCQSPSKSSSPSLNTVIYQHSQHHHHHHHHQQQQQQQQHQSSLPNTPPSTQPLPNLKLHQRRVSKNFTSQIKTTLGNDNYNSGTIINKNRHHYQQQQQQQPPQQPQHRYHNQQPGHLLDEFPTGTRANFFTKRDSCVTDTTQFSGDSCETNTTTLTTTSTFISLSGDEIPITDLKLPTRNVVIKNENNNSGNRSGIGGGDGDVISTSSGQMSPKCKIIGTSPIASEKCMIRKSESSGTSKKHAINIISNPAYQVLHGSHSTLDRTCSDSIVSLKYRKSTSDLTADVEETVVPVVSSGKSRRRGSSKGGLAYLASRRSSRDSIKSACSNTSIFSNEDIGPLAFQSSTRGRQRRTSNFLELPVPDHVRPRVCSLPDRPYNPRLSDDLYRLRHFSISKGTVVNCGDSIISRRSRSNTSVNSTTSRASERSPFDGSCCGGGYANIDSMPPSPTDSEPPPPPRYRIVMLGDASVGKTALVSQFMTSEYMHTYDASLDDEFGEKTVSVLLDDEESELVFIDHPSVEMSVENSLTTYEPHACVIIYSIVDRNSFRVAEEIINYLWSENITKDKAVILVANKADLARSRVITISEGKSLASTRDIKFIETSSGIQHNVDELLVGVLKQIRLKEKRGKKALASTKMKNSRTHISLHMAKEIFQKICLSDITKSKSCENLHVL